MSIIIENICMIIVFALSLVSLCLIMFYIDYSDRKKMSDGYYEKDLDRRKKNYQFKMERKNAVLDYKLRKSKLKLLKKLTVSDFFDIDDDFGDYS